MDKVKKAVEYEDEEGSTKESEKEDTKKKDAQVLATEEDTMMAQLSSDEEEEMKEGEEQEETKEEEDAVKEDEKEEEGMEVDGNQADDEHEDEKEEEQMDTREEEEEEEEENFPLPIHPRGFIPNSVLVRLIWPPEETAKIAEDRYRPPQLSEDQLTQIETHKQVRIAFDMMIMIMTTFTYRAFPITLKRKYSFGKYEEKKYIYRPNGFCL